jgi:hypothetical protein
MDKEMGRIVKVFNAFQNNNLDAYPSSLVIDEAQYKKCIVCNNPIEQTTKENELLYDENKKGPYCKNCYDKHILKNNDFKLREAAAPGQEKWIKKHKKEFIKQYGKEKGLSILYATAWDRYNKLNEAVNKNNIKNNNSMCTNCSGDGILPCQTCKGQSGNISCSECYGCGEITCPVCKGKGYIQENTVNNKNKTSINTQQDILKLKKLAGLDSEHQAFNENVSLKTSVLNNKNNILETTSVNNASINNADDSIDNVVDSNAVINKENNLNICPRCGAKLKMLNNFEGFCPDCYDYVHRNEGPYGMEETVEHTVNKIISESSDYYITCEKKGKEGYTYFLYMHDNTYTLTTNKKLSTLFNDLKEAKSKAAELKSHEFSNGIINVKIVPVFNENRVSESQENLKRARTTEWANSPNEQIAGWTAVINDADGPNKEKEAYPNRLGDNPIKVAVNKKEEKLHEDENINTLAKNLYSKFNMLNENDAALAAQQLKFKRIKERFAAAGFMHDSKKEEECNYAAHIFSKDENTFFSLSKDNKFDWAYHSANGDVTEGEGMATLMEVLDPLIPFDKAGEEMPFDTCYYCYGEGCPHCEWTGKYAVGIALNHYD